MQNNIESEKLTANSDISNQVLVYLRKIMRAIDLHSKKLIQEFKLTGPQLIVLKEIESNNQISIGEIAKNISLSNATVTGIVNRLELRGLVKRIRHDSDRRKVIVLKTNKADSLLKNAPPPLQEQFTSLFENLDESRRTQIMCSLQKVSSMMGAQELDAAPVLSSFPPAASEVAVSKKLIDEPVIHDVETETTIDKKIAEIKTSEKAVDDIIIHEIRSLSDKPDWISLEELASFIYKNIKPFEDTLEDTRRAVEIAIDSDQPKGAFVLLAEIDKKPVGALIMHRTNMKGYIPENILLMVCVHPSMRGKGLGGKIIKKGIELADGDVKLHVEYDNPAKQVYEKIGFTSKYAEMRYHK
ncbi:MAG: MarR family transcriptional regulator [candidate division Zixibacteria bacterium]|nr:MarR family transcriptional regulator [candidate division Zixibacteria bacterium]